MSELESPIARTDPTAQFSVRKWIFGGVLLIVWASLFVYRCYRQARFIESVESAKPLKLGLVTTKPFFPEKVREWIGEDRCRAMEKNESVSFFDLFSMNSWDPRLLDRCADYDPESVGFTGIVLLDSEFESLSRTRSLKSIFFSSMNLSDDQLLRLSELPKLESIELMDVTVTEAAIQKFKLWRPDVTIEKTSFITCGFGGF